MGLKRVSSATCGGTRKNNSRCARLLLVASRHPRMLVAERPSPSSLLTHSSIPAPSPCCAAVAPPKKNKGGSLTDADKEKTTAAGERGRDRKAKGCLSRSERVGRSGVGERQRVK
jgi:hypothetical protein